MNGNSETGHFVISKLLNSCEWTKQTWPNGYKERRGKDIINNLSKLDIINNIKYLVMVPIWVCICLQRKHTNCM